MAVTNKLPDPATNVIEEVPPGFMSTPMSGAGAVGNLVISVASAADTIIPWGFQPRERDIQLRSFWPTEQIFSSALFTTIAQYVAFGFTLTGPPRSVRIAQEMLNAVQFGNGWEELMTPFLVDYFTQDNGAFMEVVRTDDDPRAPVVSLNHLDAHRCIRTGRHEEPVIYIDRVGKFHQLKWYQVIAMTELPSPIEESRGIQYCVLTRILRAAQTMRDISVLNHEKASGRFTRQVHLVGGIQTRIIEDAVAQKQSSADAAGFMRYVQPLIVASLDPTSKITKETIDLASLPEDFDEQKSLQSYIIAIAMAFGNDYSNFAPIMTRGSGGGGTAAGTAKVSSMRTRGKGPGLFMKKIERAFNFHGLVPSTVTFSFGEQDIAEDMEKTELKKSRALEREIRIRSGEITTQVARQMAVDDGDLDERYLMMMRDVNTPEEVTATSTQPSELLDPSSVKPGLPGPDAPPAPPGNTAIAQPPNSNQDRNRAPSQDQKRTPGATPPPGTRA